MRSLSATSYSSSASGRLSYSQKESGPRSRPKRESYAGVEELHKQKDAQGDNADGPRAAEYSQLKLHGREDDVELLRGKLRQLCQLNPRGSVESEHSGEASCPELILVSGVSG